MVAEFERQLLPHVIGYNEVFLKNQQKNDTTNRLQCRTINVRVIWSKRWLFVDVYVAWS